MACSQNWFQSFTAYMDQPHSNHWLWLFAVLIIISVMFSPSTISRSNKD